LHQIVDALDPAVGDLTTALVGGTVVERHLTVDVDAERTRLAGEQVGEFGVAQQRLRRNTPDVEAHPAPVAFLDDGGVVPELGRTNRGGVSTGARTQHHNVEVFAHGRDYAFPVSAGGSWPRMCDSSPVRASMIRSVASRS